MNHITVVSKTQRIVVNPSTQRISIINAGPQGPPGLSDAAGITNHINDTTPHPPYDDMNDLALIFENGLI